MKRWLSVLVVFSCIIALFGCENGTIKESAMEKDKYISMHKFWK